MLTQNVTIEHNAKQRTSPDITFILRKRTTYTTHTDNAISELHLILAEL